MVCAISLKLEARYLQKYPKVADSVMSVTACTKMGLYDREAKQILGIGIWDEIMKEVGRGAIDDHRMRDIAALLGDKIRGNHLRRMKNNNSYCDEVEMREILSDWYNLVLFGYNSKTAIGELVKIFNDPSVNLPQIASFMEKALANVTRIVLLGESGSGKSSVGNCLLGLASDESFEESGGTQSCTLECKEVVGTWITNTKLCSIIDTPGMNDSDNKDTDHMRSIVKFLKDTSYVNVFLLVRNGRSPRMSHSFKRMLSTFELTFGGKFWRHIAINVSQVNYKFKNFVKQVADWKSEINTSFPKSLGASLNSVILDIEDDKAESFKDNAEKIWTFAALSGKFACIDLEVVTSKLDDHKAEVERLREELDNALQELQECKGSIEKENITSSSAAQESMERVPDGREWLAVGSEVTGWRKLAEMPR